MAPFWKEIRPGTRPDNRATAFGTPTIVHFVALGLLLVAIRNAWDTVTFVAVARSHAARRPD